MEWGWEWGLRWLTKWFSHRECLLLPMPPQATWHIAVDGQSQGPYNDAQLMQMIQSGGVLASTNVWSPSLGKWMAAGQVPQLSGHFGAVPPPPPPS